MMDLTRRMTEYHENTEERRIERNREEKQLKRPLASTRPPHPYGTFEWHLEGRHAEHGGCCGARFSLDPATPSATLSAAEVGVGTRS